MSLRAKFTCYLVGLHLVMAVLAGLALADRGLWLLGVEMLFVVSLGVASTCSGISGPRCACCARALN